MEPQPAALSGTPRVETCSFVTGVEHAPARCIMRAAQVCVESCCQWNGALSQEQRVAAAKSSLAPVVAKHPGRRIFVCIGEKQPLCFDDGVLVPEAELAPRDDVPIVRHVAVFRLHDGGE